MTNLKTRNRLGMAGYVQILAELPGTTEEIQARTGMCMQTLRVLLREFRVLRLIHCSELRAGLPRSSPIPVWALGDAPPRFALRPFATVPRAQVIAFASIVRALEHPCTLNELAQETGVGVVAVGRVVKALRARKLSHVATWELRHGTPVQRHVMGRGPDARRPRPQSRQQINAKHNARRSARMQMLEMLRRTAGPVSAMA